MLCCFKDNGVSTISSTSPTLAGEKRNLGAKKKSAKQIVPFEYGVATDANLAQMSNRSSPQMEVCLCVRVFQKRDEEERGLGVGQVPHPLTYVVTNFLSPLQGPQSPSSPVFKPNCTFISHHSATTRPNRLNNIG